MSHKILIIEDDSTLVRGLKDNYRNQGFNVKIAMNGVEALKIALEFDPDLIILDIMLPEKNGYEVCEELRYAGRDMPIIMLTAKGQEQDIIRGLNMGADDYVTKPFSIAELLARSHAFLRRHKKHKPRQFCFANFEFKLDSQQLYKNGCEIKLTPKEFLLLKLLCEKQGKALTRETIINVVWSQKLINTHRSVDRCINTLRKKIENNPAQPQLIHSIRDIGYRFDPE